MFIFEGNMIIETTMEADLTLHENYGLQVILYNSDKVSSCNLSIRMLHI